MKKDHGNASGAESEDMEQEITRAAFIQREENRYLHSYDEELLQYEYLRDGDMRSIEESKRMFRGNVTGHLSDDPLRDKRYLFVAATTLATRFAIEGGMESQYAYHMSDLYIQRMDRCSLIQEICDLETEMFVDFTRKMADIHKQKKQGAERDSLSSGRDERVSKPVSRGIDYIYLHLHEKISLQEISQAVGLSPNYLNSLFKQETGRTIQQYIRFRRIETAKNLILYSDFSLTEIGEYLAFSSSSHFIRIFREETGMTPKEYLKNNFRTHERWSK